MAEFLATQVRLGKITLEQVPAKWRDAVGALMNTAS